MQPKLERDLLSILDDPEACIALLKSYRWPKGFICPHCTSRQHRRVQGRPAWCCLSCKRQTRLTANTPLHGSHLPLRHWVYAIFMVGGRKQSISALQLSKDVRIAYSSALSMLRRLRRVLDEGPCKLGRGTIDFGARRLGSRDARDWPVTASEQLARAQSLMIAVERLARVDDEPPRGGFLRAAAVPTGLDATHFVPVVTREGMSIRKHPTPRFHTIAQNFVDFIRGTFHGVSRKHLAGYVREFVFRFNRARFERHLPGLVGRRLMGAPRALRASLTTTPPSLALEAAQLPPLEEIDASLPGAVRSPSAPPPEPVPAAPAKPVDPELAVYDAWFEATEREPWKHQKLDDFRIKKGDGSQ